MHVLLIALGQDPWTGLAAQVTREGHTVEQIDSFLTGRKYLDTRAEVDLVIVDANPPNQAMIKMVAGLKRDLRLAAIPIIAAGSAFDQDVLQKLLAMRVENIMVIPTDQMTLQAKLASAAQHGRRTLLVVDDESTIVDYLRDLLEIERFKVLTAASGEEALQILHSSEVDAVVSDITMPGMSGLDLLVEVKNNLPHIPVILITGNVGKYPPRDLIAAGADGYFSKPFRNKELVYTLRGILAAYDHQHRHRRTTVRT